MRLIAGSWWSTPTEPLFSLTYGTSQIVMGVQGRRTEPTLHSVTKNAA
jgi:hypothetical protein